MAEETNPANPDQVKSEGEPGEKQSVAKEAAPKAEAASKRPTAKKSAKPKKEQPAAAAGAPENLSLSVDDVDKPKIIKAKGSKSWTQYRLETMREVTENLIVKPAKAVNPKCKVIIKMANWYDQYAGMGNDTEKVPLIADGMFSGTESRTWFGQEQHLQPYLSYDIMRFMDNLKPGVNRGGWVDQGGANPIDRYSEQPRTAHQERLEPLVA